MATTAKTTSDSWELFALKREFLTSDSNITQIAIHRKLFNDCFVNFLRNKVINERSKRTYLIDFCLFRPSILDKRKAVQKSPSQTARKDTTENEQSVDVGRLSHRLLQHGWIDKCPFAQQLVHSNQQLQFVI